MKFRLFIGIVFFCVAFPLFAQEDFVEEAEKHLLDGNALLSKGQYEKARQHFAAAQALLSEASGPYAGLGFAWKGLGNCIEALPNFETYLRLAPKGSLVKEVNASIADCEKEDAKLSLRTEPEGIPVILNTSKRSLGQTPDVFSIKPGSHTIRLEKRGYEPVFLTVDLKGGRLYKLPTVTLAKVSKSRKSKARKTEKTRTYPDRFSLLLVPTTGTLADANAFGFKMGGTFSADVPFTTKSQLNLGLGLELGGFKQGGFFEPTLRLASHIGWERFLGKSKAVRVGVDSEIGFLFHLNSVDNNGVAELQSDLHAIFRVAPTLRFSLSGPHSLMFQPIAITIDPTDFADLFQNVRMFEIFSFGYEQNF